MMLKVFKAKPQWPLFFKKLNEGPSLGPQVYDLTCPVSVVEAEPSNGPWFLFQLSFES